MEKFEQEIKSRLAKDSSMAGIESESLWNGISQTFNPAAVPVNKKRFTLLWVFGLVMAGGIVWSALSAGENSMAVYVPRGENEGVQTDYFLDSDKKGVKELSYSENEVDRDIAVLAVQNTIDSTKENDIKTDGNKEVNSLKSTTTNTQNPTKLVEDRTEKSPLLPEEPSLTPLAISGELTPEPGDVYEAFDGKKASVVSKSLESTDDILRSEDIVEETNANVLQRITSRKGNFPPKNYFNRVFEAANSPKVKMGISLNIYAGLITVQNKFVNSSAVPGLADSLDTSISGELGGRLGVSCRISKGSNWNLNVGLEYAQWNDRFDKVLMSDTLVFETPSSQELSPAINIRTIKHYNKLSSLSIPVEFELFKDTKTLRFGLGLGASYSVVFGQEGRLLKDEITVIDYSQRNKRYSNFFSLRANPSVGYKLSEKLMVNALCTVGIQSHGDNSFTNLKSNSLTIMPAIGVRFNY